MEKNRERRDACGWTLKKTWLIMRVTIFFVLLGMFQVSGETSYAQETRMSIKLTNVRLADVLNEIENQSDFYFLYNQDLIDVNRKVNLHVDNQKIDAILVRLFDQTEVKYFVRDRQIILTNLDEKKMLSQQRDLSGTVRGPDGAVIPGVTVVVKGTSSGTNRLVRKVQYEGGFLQCHACIFLCGDENARSPGFREGHH